MTTLLFSTVTMELHYLRYSQNWKGRTRWLYSWSNSYHHTSTLYRRDNKGFDYDLLHLELDSGLSQYPLPTISPYFSNYGRLSLSSSTYGFCTFLECFMDILIWQQGIWDTLCTPLDSHVPLHLVTRTTRSTCGLMSFIQNPVCNKVSNFWIVKPTWYVRRRR